MQRVQGTGSPKRNIGTVVGTSHEGTRKGTLSLGQLVFIGVGGIIGAGFFLGCGLPIQVAGPAVLLSFVLGTLLTAQVTGVLTSMAANHPVQGSFQVYAHLYLGRFAGYMEGWLYYISSVLTIASEAVAMGVFVRVWVPIAPIWLSSLIFSAIILLINAFGVRNFGRIESFMSVVKMAALVGFILFVLWRFFVPGGLAVSSSPTTMTGGFFPHGFSGVMQAMLVVVFAFAGIGVFGSAAAEVQDSRDIDKGALWTIGILAGLYLLSIGGLLLVEPWQRVGTQSSPFVTALQHAGHPLLGSILNGVVMIAAFSVMAGSVFSANQILFSLGQSGEAPGFVAKVSSSGVSYGSLAITAIGIFVAILAAVSLPANVYNVLISASSYTTFASWVLILWTFLRWRRTREGRTAHKSLLALGQPVSTVITMAFIALLVGYAFRQPDQRIGLYAFIVLLGLTAFSYVLIPRRHYA